jgi:hypothetical protein
MLPPSLAARQGHPLLTQQMSIILRLRQPVKGVFAYVWAGVREAVLVAARMVAVCWMVAIVGW